jgi:WXXGXW repeat (2 copies)
MRRLMMICLATAALFASTAALTGCIVEAPRRPHYERVWVPGYWAPGHVWVEGRYR